MDGQDKSTQFDNLIEAPPSRVTFSVAKFVETYKLGIPVAGYYFKAMHGDWNDHNRSLSTHLFTKATTIAPENNRSESKLES